MAVTFLPGDKLIGLSGDDKPTWVVVGATFTESDTGLQFAWDGTTWVGPSASGYFNSFLGSVIANISSGSAGFAPGPTPYDASSTGSPATSDNADLIINDCILLGSVSGTASSVGDTITLYINGSQVGTTTASPSAPWSLSLDQIFYQINTILSGELVVEPSDGSTTDGVVDGGSFTVYPANFVWKTPDANELSTGVPIGLSITGNAAISGTTTGYDFYWFGSSPVVGSIIVSTLQWNNTDQYAIETQYGNVSQFLGAQAAGSANLYPTQVYVYFMYGV